jgi:hypothetical protein
MFLPSLVIYFLVQDLFPAWKKPNIPGVDIRECLF